MKKLFLSAVLLIGSTNVYSANVDTGYFTIDKVRLSDHTGNGYIDPVGATEEINESCTQKNLYAFHKDDPLFSEIYASALAAAASGKQIKIWVSNDDGDCIAGYQKLRVIEINF